MNTKALRQKILDLAIHGKLVPQDPNDEPASVLLERIKAEKERLIKEGKIKRAKRSKVACDKPHYPYELPQGWAWCKLQEIVQITNGHSQKDVEDKNGKYPIYGSGGIIGKAIDFLCEAGSTIIGRKGTINNPIFVEERFWNIDTAFGMKPQYAISDKYFFYFCQYFDFSELDKSTAVPSLTQSAINEILIPVPPKNEQERIVKEIIRCFSIVEILEKGKVDLQETINQAKSKILNLAIHGKLVPQDPTDEPASELLKRVNPKAEIACDNAQYGKPPKWVITKVKSVFVINPKNKADDNVKAGFVPMTNINEGYSNHFSFEIKDWGKIRNGFTHFADGDIAVAKISPCLENRKSMILQDLPNGIGAGTTELHVFRPLCVDSSFGLYFFKSDYFIKQCVGTFNGVVGQQRVGKGIVEEILFPLPPLQEQHRIVAKIEELFAQLDNIASSL